MLQYIRNLSAESVYPGNPWEGEETSLPSEARVSKEAMIKWAGNIATSHCFFSAFEGESDSLRLSKDNQAYQIHGIIADYDAAITLPMLDSVIANSPTEFLPNYISRTFSNGARMVWLFETPIIVAGNKVAAAFMKVVMKELKLKKLLPGLDEAALLDPNKYYEKGHNWKATATHQIRSEFTWKWMSDAGKKLAWKTGEVKIPLDVLHDQIEKEYPGMWSGPFELGARTRRFWDKSADNDTAAILRETGIQCFTGTEPFIGWSQLLGEAFVKRYDADRIGKVLDNIFFDDASAKYWFRDGRERWVSESSTGISRLLRTDFGLDGRIPKGGTYSEIDKALLEVQKFRRVDAALPFIHYRSGLVRIESRQFLNTSWAQCMQPAKISAGDWGTKFPWTARYISEYLVDQTQLNAFLAWWKHVYSQGLVFKPRLGQALFFVGPQNCGKTLLTQKVVGASLGGAMDARSFLVEGNQFSGSCLEHPVMSVDDSTSVSDRKKYLQYSAMVKSIVANPHIEYNQKFRAAGQIYWLGRILVSLNDDAQSLQMIPDLEQSLMDKIMLFKVGPPQTFEFPDKYELESTLKRELPWLLRWLLDWEVPEENKGDARFGVTAYHHPDLHRQALESDHSSSFLDVLGLFLDEYQVVHPEHTYWEGSVAQLLADMGNCERVTTVAREFNTRQVGGYLRALSNREYGIERLTKKRRSFGHLWRVPISHEE